MTDETRRRILGAAEAEFAEKGFHATTVRGICRRAGANVAAVNYHFRSKESLYKSVVDHLFSMVGSENTAIAMISSRSEWEGAIRRWTEKFFANITNPDPVHRRLHMIMFREMLDPSSVFPEIYGEYIRPRLAAIEHYVRMGLPSSAAAEDVNMIIFSIISQCIFYEQNKVLVREMFGSGFQRSMGAIRRSIVDRVLGGIMPGLKYRRCR